MGPSNPRDEELALYSQWNQRVAESIPTGPGTTPGDAYQRWGSMSYRDRVMEMPPGAFDVPQGLRRFLPAPLVGELQSIFDEVREIHERYVGLSRIEASIELNASEEQRNLHARGQHWAEGVARLRLGRPAPKDRGSPFRRFLRLYDEVVPALDMVGTVIQDGEVEERTCAGHQLGQTADYLTWTYFENTWLELYPAIAARQPHPRLQRERRSDLSRCATVASIYHWNTISVWDSEISRLCHRWKIEPVPLDRTLPELARMAEDLFEMKPFLMRTFGLRSCIIDLPGGYRSWFMWDVNDRVGNLALARDNQDLEQQFTTSFLPAPLVLDSHGRLACYIRPWLDVRTPSGMGPDVAAGLNLLMLERVHALLYGQFEQLDLDAIIQSWSHRSEPETEEDDRLGEEEVIAASVVARERCAKKSPRITSSLRLNDLLTILEGTLGATSRDGKGSELVLFRPGGRVTTVGRHQRNPLVSAAAIRRILKALGVRVDEWLGAVGA